MLSTVQPPVHAPAVGAFRCAHSAFALNSGRGWWLGRGETSTSARALEWLRLRVRETAVQLDPPAWQIAEAWLSDRQAQATALLRLDHGEPVVFTLVDDQAQYEVSVQPVLAGPARPTQHSRSPAARSARTRPRHASGGPWPTS